MGTQAELAADEESVRQWRAERAADALPEDVRAGLVAKLADVLTPVFLFISRGRVGRTMELRSWVVLHETRLDLIGGESIGNAAKRFGVDPKRLRVLIAEFRDAVPGYRSGTRKPEATIEAMRRSAAARGGRGKESFFGGPLPSGSELTGDLPRDGEEN